MLSKVGR